MKDRLVFKNDKYRKNRGGASRWLLISCASCDSPILLYQKDGPGALKRLYLDRIFTPQNLVGLQENNLDEIPNLACKKCKATIGMPIIYKKENRLAFRLFAGAIKKKFVKANELEKIKL